MDRPMLHCGWPWVAPEGSNYRSCGGYFLGVHVIISLVIDKAR